jgi:hypothetical protein
MYERVFGEKPHYEPAGYRCETCKIFYDADTKQVSRMASTVAKKELGGISLVAADTERMQKLHEPHAKTSKALSVYQTATL